MLLEISDLEYIVFKFFDDYMDHRNPLLEISNICCIVQDPNKLNSYNWKIKINRNNNIYIKTSSCSDPNAIKGFRIIVRYNSKEFLITKKIAKELIPELLNKFDSYMGAHINKEDHNIDILIINKSDIAN